MLVIKLIGEPGELANACLVLREHFVIDLVGVGVRDAHDGRVQVSVNLR